MTRLPVAIGGLAASQAAAPTPWTPRIRLGLAVHALGRDPVCGAPGACATVSPVRPPTSRAAKDQWRTPMAEPVRSPSTPHPRNSRLHAVEAPGTPSIAGLRTLMVQDMPKLPSLAALHALTDHDLPSTDGLRCLRAWSSSNPWATRSTPSGAFSGGAAPTSAWPVICWSTTRGARTRTDGCRRSGSRRTFWSSSEWRTGLGIRT